MKKNVASFGGLLLQQGKIKDQFYIALKQLIVSGQLQPGKKIPSSRTLSEMMSISRNSVLSGLDRLIDEGYLQTKKGSGTYVTSIIPDDAIEIKTPAVHATRMPKEHKPEIGPQVQLLQDIWHKTRPYAGHHMTFNIGVGCSDLFPYELWGRLSGRVWRQYRHQDWKLNQPMGYLPLRQAIGQYIRATRGVDCHDEQILIVNGTQQAMSLAAQVLLQKGDHVWLDEPGYDGALGAFTAVGAKVCPVMSDKQGMNIDAAIQHWPQAKMMFTSPSHQFPLGGTLSLARRMALLDWAANHDMWIFEDDYNSEFRYHSQPLPALQGLDKHQRVIYAGTFSKMMFPGFHIGFLVIPENLITPFTLAKYYTDTRTPYLDQAILANFISQGHYARHVRRIRKACYERQQVMLEAIQRYLSGVMVAEPLDSGIHLLCWLSADRHESEVIAQCRQVGLGAQPLSRYCQTPSERQGILLGFAAHPAEEIVEGIKKMAQILAR